MSVLELDPEGSSCQADSQVLIFEQPPSCISLLGIGDKLGACLTSTLSGTQRPSTAQSIVRHDYRSKLHYLLVKIRTALDRDLL